MQTCYSNVIRRHLPTLHDAHYGYDFVARGDVPTKGFRDLAEKRYEVSVLSMDQPGRRIA